MKYRSFGTTDLRVSERGFGAWAIGGASYGRVAPQDALQALERAEELGCNFVDTAAVYGDSESLLGQFLHDRRQRWHVASKVPGRPDMTTCIEQQLRRLRTDWIDFYQLHWTPTPDQHALYDELDALKRAGKIRFAGVSLYSAAEIDDVIDRGVIDGIQVRCSLLEPDPLLRRLAPLRARRMAVVVRSALKEGFLTGKYSGDAMFPDPSDQRHTWPARRIADTARQAAAFGFVADEAGSMPAGAIAYPLSFPEVSTVILSTKSVIQAEQNFGAAIPSPLSPELLRRIEQAQRAVGVNPVSRPFRMLRKARRILTRSAWRT